MPTPKKRAAPAAALSCSSSRPPPGSPPHPAPHNSATPSLVTTRLPPAPVLPLLPTAFTTPGGAQIPVTPSPVNVPLLSRLLTNHPDRRLCDMVVSRFLSGADIGYRGGPAGRFCPNNRSATMRPDAVSRAIQAEIERGHTYGPFRSPPLPDFRVNPLSARDKPDGSVRLLLDMSQPAGIAVNDGISREEFTVQYTSVDEAVRLIFANGGQGALVAKADVRHAFRLVPVSQGQWHLQGFYWNGRFYFDTRLVFGSRSSPRLFNDFADCLEWIFSNHSGSTDIRHYLDDYFTVGPRGSDACSRAYNSIVEVSGRLGVPLSPNKCVPPSTCLELLGIMLDTENMTASLPPGKLSALLLLLRTMRQRKKCTKRELLSLGGKLAHASTCVPPGRAFTRRILDAAHSVDRLGHRVRLTADLHRDLGWWNEYLPLWNGTFPLIPPSADRVYSADVFTDSSEWGGAAYHGSSWFVLPWPGTLLRTTGAAMTWLEMIPVVAALLVWGPRWHGRRVRLHCDNMGVIAVWRRGWSHNPLIMDLLRQLAFICARQSCHLDMTYIPSRDNVVADALSRDRVPEARQALLTLCPAPDPVPAPVQAYLTHPASSAHLLSGHRL